MLVECLKHFDASLLIFYRKLKTGKGNELHFDLVLNNNVISGELKTIV